MERAEARLREVVRSSDPRLAEVSLHLIEAGGRRLRPALVLASAIAVGGCDAVSECVVDAAVAVELLHLASLHHDDVLDCASVRRGRASANAVWGNSVAVLTGDALLAQAFSLAAELRRDDLRRFSRAVTELCAGQVAESQAQYDRQRGVADYEASIRGKTAALFAASCWLGASAAGARRRLIHALERYGWELGIAFQLIDDVLDLHGDPDVTGKARGGDLRAGVFTLPVLLALAEDPALGDLLAEGIDEDRIAEVRRRVTAAGGDRHTVARAAGHVGKALASVSRLPLSTIGRGLLRSIAEAVLEPLARDALDGRDCGLEALARAGTDGWSAG
jgi:heptaprenyl diphosphate synthase